MERSRVLLNMESDTACRRTSPVAAIDLEVQFVRERIALPLEAALYGRARVRHGAAAALGSRIVAAAVEHRADDATLSVEVRREA
jgi:hypothetical protein